MQPPVTVSVPARRITWVLVTVQVVVAAAYFYGVVAYLTTDAAYIPEQAPPGWAVPATLFGPLVSLLTMASPLGWAIFDWYVS